MNKIHNNILETVGNTPIVSIGKLGTNYVFGKLERVNPTGTVYDRVANILIKSMTEVRADTNILCSVEDEFGTAIAMVCAVNKLSCTIVSTHQLTKEIQQDIVHYGARLELVDTIEQIELKQQELIDSNPVTNRLVMDDGMLDVVNHNLAREIYNQVVGLVNVVVVPIFASLHTQSIIDHLAIKSNKIEVIFANQLGKVEQTNATIVHTTIEEQYNSVLELYGMGICCGLKSGAAWAVVKQYANQTKNKSILAVLVD